MPPDLLLDVFIRMHTCFQRKIEISKCLLRSNISMARLVASTPGRIAIIGNDYFIGRLRQYPVLFIRQARSHRGDAILYTRLPSGYDIHVPFEKDRF